mmetsp:Transcript_68840/g.164004  ORF Transcript_68840/g.164004 Transcript_68840/m.164004 type:complete len:278 (-) Transcript_68840:76-909(-)
MQPMSLTPGSSQVSSSALYLPWSSLWYCSLWIGSFASDTSGFFTVFTAFTFASASAFLPARRSWSCSASFAACSAAFSLPQSSPRSEALFSSFETMASMCEGSVSILWTSSLDMPSCCIKPMNSSGLEMLVRLSCCFCRASSCFRVASFPASISAFILSMRRIIASADSSKLDSDRSSRPSRESRPSRLFTVPSGSFSFTSSRNLRRTSGPPFSTACSTSSLARRCAPSSPVERPSIVRRYASCNSGGMFFKATAKSSGMAASASWPSGLSTELKRE